MTFSLSLYYIHIDYAYIVNFTADFNATIGQTVTIYADARGDPSVISYKWYKNGKLLTAGSNPRIQEVDKDYLVIKNFTVNDIGIYECFPSNEGGTHNSSRTAINVNSKLF